MSTLRHGGRSGSRWLSVALARDPSAFADRRRACSRVSEATGTIRQRVLCGDPQPDGQEQFSRCNDPAGVIISVSAASGTEGTNATLDFPVSLSKAHPSRSVSMDWSLIGRTSVDADHYTGITAVAGEDYTDASGTLTFASGETSKTINISLLDDSVNEGLETFKLRLTNASGATFVEYGLSRTFLTVWGTIFSDEDTDAPTVTVTAKYPITPPVSGWFGVLVRFSEPVKGFETSDIEVTNGSVASISRTFQHNKHGNTEWYAKIAPASGLNGDVFVKVPAAAATDVFGNANTASETFVVAARGATTLGRKAFVNCAIPPDQASWERSAGGHGQRLNTASHG